jgi:hypothetical protein
VAVAVRSCASCASGSGSSWRTLHVTNTCCAASTTTSSTHTRLTPPPLPAPHLAQAELAAKEHRQKEKKEAHLYVTLRVARDEDMSAQVGSSQFFDLVDHDKVRTYRVKKNTPFMDLKKQVGGWGLGWCVWGVGCACGLGAQAWCL